MATRIIVPLIGLFLALCIVYPIQAANAPAPISVKNAQGFLDETVRPTGIKEGDVSVATGKLVQRTLLGVSLVFFALMVYAGFLWMSARDNEEQATKARNTMIASVIGIVLILGSAVFANFIVERVQKTQQVPGGPLGGGGGGGAQGCCQDRVGAYVWACRITTQSDCENVGRACDSSDRYCEATDWRFDGNLTTWDTCRVLCE